MIGALNIVGSNSEMLRGRFNPKIDLSKEISDEDVYGLTLGIYPPMFHYLRQYGIYVFRFFKNYAWKYVIIDDFLPARNFYK